MKKILIYLILLICNSSYAQSYDGWDSFICNIYQISETQSHSVWSASVLKEVNGKYYSKANIESGRYEIELIHIYNNFFKIKDTKFFIELNGYVPYRLNYRGILNIEEMLVQSPFDESYSSAGRIEKFFLAP